MPLEENTPYGSPKPDPNAPNYWDAEPEFAIEPSPWEDDPNPKPPQETGQSPVMPGGESGLPEGAIAPLVNHYKPLSIPTTPPARPQKTPTLGFTMTSRAIGMTMTMPMLIMTASLMTPS